MRKIILVISIIMIYAICANQTIAQYNIKSAINADSIPQKKLSYSIKMGTSYIASSHKNGMFSTYVSPEMNYQLTSKFSLNAGIMFMSSSIGIVQSKNSETYQNGLYQPFTGTVVYAGGSYQLNDRITLNGTAYTQLSNPLLQKGFTNSNQNNIKGVGLGIDYKLTEHSSFSIQFDMNNNPLNSGCLPRYGHTFQSPYCR